MLLLVLSTAVMGYAGSPEPWRELEREVDTAGFHDQFLDSLIAVNQVEPQAGLRAVGYRVGFGAEKLVLEASWGPFRAGYGILSATTDTSANIAQFSISAVTNRLVGALFRVRDFIRSTVDLAGMYPMFFEEHIEEGRYRAKRWALYDHRNGVVYGNKSKHPRVETEPYTLDFLSILYVLRATPIQPGETVVLPCYVQGIVYKVQVKCVEREKLKTDLGEFRCLVLEPRIAVEGRNFSKRDKVRLWLTDDDKRVLVRVRSKIKVGSVDAELVYYARDGEVWETKD
jgi:hypothetical protein